MWTYVLSRSMIYAYGRVKMLVAGSSCYYIISADVIAAAITKRRPGNLLPKVIAAVITSGRLFPRPHLYYKNLGFPRTIPGFQRRFRGRSGPLHIAVVS